MSPTIALVWNLVVAGPQGGMVVLPSSFDTREQCASAITEYQKQPTPAGWSVQCIPSASPYADDLGDDVPDHLRLAGDLRLKHKQASLEELGQLHDPVLTKDAIAGRIRRLLAMADKRAEELGIPDTESSLTPEMLADEA